MNWYLEVLRKYAVFNGRARRKEYWFFVLFNVLISIILGFIDGLLGLTDSGGLGPLRGLYTLAVLIPSLAVAVRRLHDTGKSGWFLLLALIPCVGGIILLIFMAQEGESGGNQYGSDPKEETI
jgi:uncharacterized membrane protein YhaH (DUF805 family)